MYLHNLWFCCCIRMYTCLWTLYPCTVFWSVIAGAARAGETTGKPLASNQPQDISYVQSIMWPPSLMSTSIYMYVLSFLIISCSVPFSAAHRTVGNFWETQGGSLVMQSVLGTLSCMTCIMHKQTASQCFTIVWWNLFISDHPCGDSFWPLWSWLPECQFEFPLNATTVRLSNRLSSQ